MSGLMKAAHYGDIARMKQLFSEGASITERDAYGYGVLHYAAANAQYTAMRWLLTEAGASINEVGIHGLEPSQSE
jgi:ankyrin repeat protein